MMDYLTLLAALKDNDGATLKRGRAITFRTGYQVATSGWEFMELELAAAKIAELGGSCGIWYSAGVYYIDRSCWVRTKKAALELGRTHNQISILGWKKMELIYC